MELTLIESLDILGVSRNASKEDIKHAYKKQAFICHPDRKGDPSIFKKLTNARDIVLSSKENLSEGFTGRDIFNNWISCYSNYYSYK